jgi:alkylhydroperoxidase family enzyme
VNVLEAALRCIASDLERHRRQWALVGGFAVSARAEPRFTRDIDVAVMVDDDLDGERLVRLLLASRYRPLASVEQDETGRLATVRLGCPLGDGDVVVDLLFASSGIEPEITRAAEVTEVVPGLSLPIATTGHLIALKLLARDDQARPQDLADLRALRAVATAADLGAARAAVGLITARGFDRGRDLTAALKEIEDSPGKPAND